MTLKKFYLRNYPTDELGAEINGESTFDGLIQILLKNDDVYEYIGVEDSLVRERLFQRLSLNSEPACLKLHSDLTRAPGVLLNICSCLDFCF